MSEQEPTSVDVLTSNTTSDVDKTRFAVKRSTTSGAAPVALSEGMLIKNRYLLDAKIGSGGMSDVFRATDTFLQQANVENCMVAIKVLQQQFVHQSEALQLLLQEAHKTQQLSHPNIVRVFDVDSDQQHYFIVMEYLDGESLDQVIKRYKPKGLPLKSALNLLSQIATALHYAHKTGIVHADLKPANIMVDRSGIVKVLDFGVAQSLQQNQDIYAAIQPSENTPLSGYTPAYASIELLKGHSPSIADDTFSFACLCYELLTSKHPFDRMPADKALAEHKVAMKPSHLNLLQWQALKKALQFDATLRQITPLQLVQQFNRQLWRPVVAAAALVAISVTGWHLQQQQANALAELQQRLQHNEQQQEKFQRFSDSNAAELLVALGADELTPIQKSALLHVKQPQLIRHFEQQIDQLISDRTFNYPNYPEIERILTQASAMYPDSHYLTELSSSMLRSKQTAIEVLRSQLNQLLVNKQYQQNDDIDLFKIVAELSRIDHSYVIEVDSNETAAFISAYQQAENDNDAIALQQLIKVGELIFADHAQTSELVGKSKALASAVDAMAQYRQQRSDAPDTAFPYQAAEIFYQHSFMQLETELSNSAKASEIDVVYNKLQQFNDVVPADFSLHIALRRKLADKYLTLSGQLLQSNQVRSAERLMRKANELMNSISS
mgnify:FL=1